MIAEMTICAEAGSVYSPSQQQQQQPRAVWADHCMPEQCSSPHSQCHDYGIAEKLAHERHSAGAVPCPQSRLLASHMPACACSYLLRLLVVGEAVVEGVAAVADAQRAEGRGLRMWHVHCWVVGLHLGTAGLVQAAVTLQLVGYLHVF